MTEAEQPQNRTLHCWKDGPRVGVWPRDCGMTCMLLDGHDGPHEWKRDDQIMGRFKP